MNLFQKWAKQNTVAVTSHDQSLYKEIMEHGGASRNPDTGETPKGGYMVGQHASMGGKEAVIPEESFSPEHIAEHRQGVHFDHDTYQGGWKSDGYVYLDISKNHQDRDKAISEGFRHKQKAIYDLNKGEDINIGARDDR